MTVSSTSSPTRALSKTERPDDRRPIPEHQHMFVHHQAAAWPLLLAVLLPLTVARCLTADGASLADAVDDRRHFRPLVARKLASCKKKRLSQY